MLARTPESQPDLVFCHPRGRHLSKGLTGCAKRQSARCDDRRVPESHSGEDSTESGATRHRNHGGQEGSSEESYGFARCDRPETKPGCGK